MADHTSLDPRLRELSTATPIKAKSRDRDKLAPVMFSDSSNFPLEIKGVQSWASDDVEVGWSEVETLSEDEFALLQTCSLSSSPSPLSITIDIPARASSPIVVEIPADESTDTIEIEEEQAKGKGKMRWTALVRSPMNDTKNRMRRLSQLLHYTPLQSAHSPSIRRTATSEPHPQPKAQKLRSQTLPVSEELDRLCSELFEYTQPNPTTVERCINGILMYHARRSKLQYQPISRAVLSWICGLRTGLRPESDDVNLRVLWLMLAINSVRKGENLPALSGMIRNAFYDHTQRPIPSLVKVPLSELESDAVNQLYVQLTQFYYAIVSVRPELRHAVHESCGCSVCDRQWTRILSFGPC